MHRGSVISQQRRGAVVVSVSITMVVIMGFAMLVVDVGRLYSVKAELQRAADAAALAGVSSYLTDSGLIYDTNALSYLITQRSQETSYNNVTLQDGTILDLGDVEWGHHSFGTLGANLDQDQQWNAVDVTVRKSPQTSNGGVPYLFGPVFEHFEGSVVASARAALNDRVAGYDFSEGGGFLPFTLHIDLYNDLVANGNDDFSYDGNVNQYGDGVPEVRVFPWKVNPSGNFGSLNIGIGNQGNPAIENQILNGLSAEEVESEFGVTQLVFYNDDGSPHVHVSSGNPGMSVGMKDSLEARVGDIVGYFVHNATGDNGSNATFDLIGIRFGRLLDVKLNGNPNKRALAIQPVAYSDDSLILSDSAPPNGTYVGRIQIVK